MIVEHLVGIRKLLLTLVIFTVSCLLLWKQAITAQIWKDLNVIIIPAYLTANLGEYWLTKGSKKAPSNEDS